MRGFLVVLAITAVTGCVRDDSAVGGEAVASVGAYELSVDRLATIMVADGNVPIAREFAERLAHLWVEYTLFTERVTVGDSMLDSALVLRAMWPEVDQAVVDAYHHTIVDDQLALERTAVDSAYQAGDHRLVKHVLLAVGPEMTAAERSAARTRASRIRSLLAEGGSWDAANAQNEDPASKAAGGFLGVIVRGQMVPEFDEVVFSLEPGGLSDVFETSFGFHVVYRPPLDEVRPEFTAAVEQITKNRASEAYLATLVEAWEVSLRPDAPALMREAAGSPLRARSAGDVIGGHREADFTVADFVRWLQVLPLSTQQQVATAGDEALREMATSMIRNEALVIEARRHDIDVTAEIFADIRDRLEGEVSTVRAALGIDTGRVSAAVTAELYVRKLISDLETSVVVPVFLADALRQDADWAVSEQALDEVVGRAELIRMQIAAQRGQRSAVPASDSSR